MRKWGQDDPALDMAMSFDARRFNRNTANELNGIHNTDLSNFGMQRKQKSPAGSITKQVGTQLKANGPTRPMSMIPSTKLKSTHPPVSESAWQSDRYQGSSGHYPMLSLSSKPAPTRGQGNAGGGSSSGGVASKRPRQNDSRVQAQSLAAERVKTEWTKSGSSGQQIDKHYGKNTATTKILKKAVQDANASAQANQRVNGASKASQAQRKKRERVERDPPYSPLQQPSKSKQKPSKPVPGTSADQAVTISSDEEEEEEAVIGDSGTVPRRRSITLTNDPGKKRMVPLKAVSFGRQVFLVGELTLIVKPWNCNQLLEITGLDSKWGKPKIASRDVFALQLCKEKQFIMLQLQTRTAINPELRGGMLFADDDPKFGEEEERERDGSRFIVMYLENLDNYYTETEVKGEQCVHSIVERALLPIAKAPYDWDPTRIQHVCMAKEIVDNNIAIAESERREGLRKSKRIAGASGGTQDVSELKLVYPHQREATDAITITTLDIGRLAEGEYLNDSIVDLYFKAMSKGDAATKKLEEFDEERRSKVCFFSSHFFAKLREYETTEFDKAYAGVERWGKHKDIFKTKFAFFPIAEHLHWSLAVLCNMNMMQAPGALAAEGDDSEEVPAIVFLDSLNMHSANRIATYLRKYVTKEWRRVNKEAPGDGEFGAQDLVLCRPNAPMQSNGCDCGVFVLEYAEELCMQWKNVTRRSIKKHMRDHIRRDSFGAAEISKKRVHIGVLLQEFERKYWDEKEKAKKGKKVAKATEAEEAIRAAEEAARFAEEQARIARELSEKLAKDTLTESELGGGGQESEVLSNDSIGASQAVGSVDGAEHENSLGAIADGYAADPMEQENGMDISNSEEDDVANTTKEQTSQSDSDSQEKEKVEKVATTQAEDYMAVDGVDSEPEPDYMQNDRDVNNTGIETEHEEDEGEETQDPHGECEAQEEQAQPQHMHEEGEHTESNSCRSVEQVEAPSEPIAMKQSAWAVMEEPRSNIIGPQLPPSSQPKRAIGPERAPLTASGKKIIMPGASLQHQVESPTPVHIVEHSDAPASGKRKAKHANRGDEGGAKQGDGGGKKRHRESKEHTNIGKDSQNIVDLVDDVDNSVSNKGVLEPASSAEEPSPSPAKEKQKQQKSLVTYGSPESRRKRKLDAQTVEID